MEFSNNPIVPSTPPETSYRPTYNAESVTVESLIEGARLISGMVVYSAQIREVLASVTRFAPHKNSVLIQGESGTGKELVARSLHSLGAVPDGPFVTFNCSNLMDSLADAQLFGHVKGAFTDARVDSLGYFRSAHGGTLFLDEISELPLRLQPKLLRAVESHEVQPVGSSRTYKVDIKLISATNCDLHAMVKSGSFRSDLYYRLNAAVIVVPPLRDRQCAIPALIGHFINHYNQVLGKSVRSISQPALGVMCSHSWPGNIRELAHAVEHAILTIDGDEITRSALLFLANEVSEEPGRAVAVEPVDRSKEALQAERGGFSLELAVEAASKEVLLRALKATDGDCQRAARLLEVSRFTVYRMIARHQLLPARDYHNLISRQRRAEENQFKVERDKYYRSLAQS